MSRKIVIDTGALHHLGSDKAFFECIKKAGFKYYDYTLFWKGVSEHIGIGDDYVEKAKQVKALADSYKLKCEQCHASFRGELDEDGVKDLISVIKKEIHIASILGAKIIVIHPLIYKTMEYNVNYLSNFIEDAHKYNVKIAIENVWEVKDDKPSPMCSSTPKEMKKLLSKLHDKCFCVCLDIGHAEMTQMGTSAVEMIQKLGRKIKALHIHDNDTYADQHQMPYTRDINFNKILDALKEVGYKGNITFEIETCYNRGYDQSMSLPLELYPAFVKLQYEIGKYFKNYLDK